MIRNFLRRASGRANRWAINHRAKGRRSRRGSLSSRSLTIDPLEDRRMLSAGGTQQLLNLIGFEPASAVDPNNPDIVATAQFRTVLISTDGGATFPTVVPVTPPAGYAGGGGDPTLAFDDNGNLFFGYLAVNQTPVNPAFTIAVFAAVINPQTGAILQNNMVAAETNTFDHDKEWIAVDAWKDSPFQDNAYLVWTQFNAASTQVVFSRTTDSGQNWSATQTLNAGGQGFVWPSEVAVARNGDVWTGWHTNTANTAGNLGEIRLRVSSDGGQTFQPELLPFPAGTADINDNAPPNPQIVGMQSWMQGSVQPRILIDPARPNNVYIISVDDPDNNYAVGDASDIVMARSTDYGATWTRSTISHAPFGTIQVMPTGYIDEEGNMAVTWYDTRAGQPSVGVDQMLGTADDQLMLDVYATVSADGGLTWSNDFKVNEVPFDPDLGAGDRFPPNNVLRIGEYNGHAADSDLAFVSWTANNGAQQDIAFDVFSMASAFSDRFEANNTINTATDLGAPETLTLRDLTIDPGDTQDDVDFYRITARDTGHMDVWLRFTHRAGDVEMLILDADGDIVNSDGDSSDDDEHVTFAVVEGEEYLIQVYGFGGNTNSYSLETTNTPAPRPIHLGLDPASDTGMFNNDNVTNDITSSIFVLADLTSYPGMGIPVLMAAEAMAGNDGVAVEIFAGGASVGYADPVAGTNSTVFEYTFTAGELSEGLNFITSAVRVFDNSTPMNNGRTQLSTPLLLTLDTFSPNAGVTLPDMLASSDSGMFDDDDVTNIMRPAFEGFAEAAAKVRVYANGLLVGQGVVGSDASNGVIGDGLGHWEITVEPLIDGKYTITAEIEDMAGNVTNTEEIEEELQLDPVMIWIDTINPNTAFLDLLTDSGHSPHDNITNVNQPTVSATVDDTTGGDGNPFPNEVKFRIYDRPDQVGNNGEVLVYDSFADLGGLTANGFFGSIVLDGSYPGPAPYTLMDGQHNLKLEVEDRAGNLSDDFLLDIIVDTTVPQGTIDMLDSSDTGMFDDDNVTSKMSPAFSGIAEANALVRVFAQQIDAAGMDFGLPLLIGEGAVGGDLSDVEVGGADDDGQGIWEVTVEPLDDGVYDIYAVFEDWGGNTGPAAVVDGEPEPGQDDIETRLRIEIDTIEPNTPFLDLAEASDTGRHSKDNITNDNTPTLTMTTHDENVPLHQVLFSDYLKFRIYDRLEESNEVLLYDSAVDAVQDAISVFGDGFTSGTFVERTFGPLADGTHDFKLEVEDRAGNISHDFLLDVVIDTVAPPIPSLYIDPASSDTGVPGQPSLIIDHMTSDTDTKFIGIAEADALVRLYADGEPITEHAITASDVYDGAAVAIPLDGNYAEPIGQYEITTLRDLNNPDFFPTDGRRQMAATAEDVAGNVSEPEFLDIFVDTRGPQVSDVSIDHYNDYPLFDPKPSEDGPTPLVFGLDIDFVDSPIRVLLEDGEGIEAGDLGARNGLPAGAFVYPAVNELLATTPGSYQLVGDHTGHVLITDVTFDDHTESGELGYTRVTLHFAEPLPDDRYTFTIFDTISDDVGNALDGESQAASPFDEPGPDIFPSGDLVPGGDFVARFTVDTRPEIGTYAYEAVHVDTNGNFVFDPEGEDNDQTNRDLAYQFGFTTDVRFAGNFADDRREERSGSFADGFDKLGAYGFVNGQWRWLIDTDNDGVPNINQVNPLPLHGFPVAGNFNDLHPGDEIGLFTGDTWYFDVNGDFRIDNTDIAGGIPGQLVAGRLAGGNMVGYPIVGDFDGDGLDDLGTWDANQFMFDLASGGLNGFIDPGEVINFGFPGVVERPVAADMDGDGIDDVGLWAPEQASQTPGEISEWYFLISNDFGEYEFPEDNGEGAVAPKGFVGGGDRIFGTVNTLNHPFSPAPLGNDLFAQFGDVQGIPIVGNFDPPVTGSSTGSGGGTTDGDGQTSSFDVAANTAFLEEVYRDLLDREADAGGLGSWLAAMEGGATRDDVAHGFYYSHEHMGMLVDGYYDTYLDREADAGGRAHWTQQMVDGMSQSVLAVAFLASDEYISRNSSFSPYVDSLYERVLERESERAGHDYWVSRLEGGLSRSEAVEAFVHSTEKRSTVIDYYHDTLLERSVTIDELAVYLALIDDTDETLNDVVESILASEEYFAQAYGA